MDFVVAGYPDIKNGLKNEITLLKVAALYGDSILLLSPIFNFYDILKLKDKSKNKEKEIIDNILKLYPYVKMDNKTIRNQKKEIESFKEIIYSKKYEKSPFVYKAQVKSFLSKSYDEMLNSVVSLIGKNEIDSINILKNKKILKVAKIKNTFLDVDEFMDEYLELANKSTKEFYPLLDSRMESLLISVKEDSEKKLSTIEENNFKISGLANNFIRTLPAFDTASISEIIDIRKELDEPLIRFRAAIIKYSKEIITLPWDSDFNMNCNQLMTKYIDPEILNIKEKIRDNSIVNNLFGSFVNTEELAKHIGTIGISLMSYFGSQANQISIKSETAAIGTFISTEILNAALKTRTGKKQIKRNDLFFYYEASQKLKA